MEGDRDDGHSAGERDWLAAAAPVKSSDARRNRSQICSFGLLTMASSSGTAKSETRAATRLPSTAQASKLKNATAFVIGHQIEVLSPELAIWSVRESESRSSGILAETCW